MFTFLLPSFSHLLWHGFSYPRLLCSISRLVPYVYNRISQYVVFQCRPSFFNCLTFTRLYIILYASTKHFFFHLKIIHIPLPLSLPSAQFLQLQLNFHSNQIVISISICSRVTP